jgi:hypothetical protein
VLTPSNLTALDQAIRQQQVDLSDFLGAASTTEQRLFSNTMSGPAQDYVTSREVRAEYAAANPPASLTAKTGLDAATWYASMSTGERPEVEPGEEAGTHQHRHARAADPGAADLGRAGPPADPPVKLVRPVYVGYAVLGRSDRPTQGPHPGSGG